MSRRGALLLILLAGCGTSTRKCKSHSVFLTLEFDSASAGADSLDVTLSLDGTTEHPGAVTRQGSTNSLEIDFDGAYPQGKTLDVSIVASAGGTVVGSGTKGVLLVAGCTADSIAINGGTGDLSVSGDFAQDMTSRQDLSSSDLSAEVDMASGDLATSDLASCSIIYVAASGGSDGNDGCTPTRAVATIGHAVSVASASQEVHVCAGTYAERLTITGVVRGGYSCTTWMRTGSFGYPTFDGTNETIVQNGNYAMGNETIVIASPSPSPSPSPSIELEGFTIQGASSGSSSSIALWARGDASIHDNKIVGGGTSSTGEGSVGLVVYGNDDVFHNSINGGTGSSSSAAFGSIGVELEPTAGTARLHDNDINGGSGSDPVDSFGSVASLGVWIGAGTYTGANAIQNNNINGGNGVASTTGGDGFGGVGVKIVGSSVVDLVQNTIDGGIGKGGKEGTVGIYSFSSGQVNIRQNRIFGGKVGIPQPSFYSSWGIQLGTGPAQITNNFIHGGDSNGTGVFTIGIISYSAADVAIQNNTIIGGATTGQSIVLYALSSTQNLVVENNLLAGDGGTSYGMYISSGCESTGIIKAFNNNGFLTGTPMYYNSASTPCSAGAIASASALETEITSRCTSATSGACTTFGGATASGNVTIAASSCPDSQCSVVSACSTNDGCFGAIFNSWDTASNGKADLLGTGWKLVTNDPCKLTHGGKDLTATVPQDFYGTTRTVPVSTGADEFDGTCL